MVIYIPILQSKYIIITSSDPILHEYYITGACKDTNYKNFTRYNTGRGSRVGEESIESDKGDESGGLSDMISHFCQVPILGLAMLPLRTPISNRKSLILHALGSGHADSGLSGCNPRST